MEIKEIKNNKKQYLSLLLIGDEEEHMINKYIDRGTMYGIFNEDIVAVCVVTNEGRGVLEIKNIAVKPQYQKMGYGRRLIEFIENKYSREYSILQVGTGDSPLTIPFYEKCGFVKSHIVKNFFVDNYSKPIFEEGKQLVDMVYLNKKL